MPQLELVSWFFNFPLAWFFLFIVVSIIIKNNFPSTNYNSVSVTPNVSASNNWLWT
ncbi:ATP synthase F0 subunit 8 (mitochondrion) [Asterias amurensis]|uniref:ATP synthase complex subunit 8 n=1 Tax=Asterias amurensis TaxID=7602 RepID=Q5KSR5_ASTAM|nr:ATP synthase F0 subunit 8 [Asterias amurensis]BAD86688.1 ATPase subunit 8 [Asterias amurensis]